MVFDISEYLIKFLIKVKFMRSSITSANKANSSRNSAVHQRPSTGGASYVELEDLNNKGKVVVHNDEDGEEVFEGKFWYDLILNSLFFYSSGAWLNIAPVKETFKQKQVIREISYLKSKQDRTYIWDHRASPISSEGLAVNRRVRQVRDRC